jgi:N4-gp56 family major capsid protein
MAIAKFVPNLWAAQLLVEMQKAHVATSLVNRDYEGIIRAQGDTVTINTIGAVTVSDYEKNKDLADPEELTTEDQKLTISQAKAYNFQVDDVDAAQSAGDVMASAMSQAAYALSDAADAYILGTIAAGAGVQLDAVTLTKDNAYEAFVKLATALDVNNVPNQGRSVVVPPEVYAMLLLDDRFVKASDAATANNALVNGLVGQVAGLTVYKSNNVVKADSTFTVTAQIPQATTYAEQVLKTEAYRLEKRFADAVKGLHVYGAKVTRPKCIASLKVTV